MAWDAEIARIVALPKKLAPPPRLAPSAEELARRRAQSAAAKKSNGVDYSMSKRQRQRVRDEESGDDDEYSCDPKTGFCGAGEPDWCTVCKNVTVTFGNAAKSAKRVKVDEQPSANFA